MPSPRRTDNPYYVPASHHRDRVVKVTLTCGHTIQMVKEPRNEGTKFACVMRLGCGYQLHWTHWHDLNSGFEKYNSQHKLS